MFRAAFVGWLIGRVVIGLVPGVMRLVEGVVWLVGAAEGLAVVAGRGGGEHGAGRHEGRTRIHLAVLTGVIHTAMVTGVNRS